MAIATAPAVAMAPVLSQYPIPILANVRNTEPFTTPRSIGTRGRAQLTRSS